MTTSVEITIHHSSALLTTFLINLNAYLIPVHSVHALHSPEMPYWVPLLFPKYIWLTVFKQHKWHLCTSTPDWTSNSCEVFQNSSTAQPTPPRAAGVILTAEILIF